MWSSLIDEAPARVTKAKVKSNFVASPIPSPQLLFHRSVLSIKNDALCKYSQNEVLNGSYTEPNVIIFIIFIIFVTPFVYGLSVFTYILFLLCISITLSFGRLAIPRLQGLEYQTVSFVQSIFVNSKSNLMINSDCPAETEPMEPGCTARFL